MEEWIYWNKGYEVNLKLRDMIERAKRAGKNLGEVLAGIEICDPVGGKTSVYKIERFDEKQNMVFGSEIEDDGDWSVWSKKLDEVLEYFDRRTLSFEWPPRYHPLTLQEVRARAID
jgi:hypothetical protein